MHKQVITKCFILLACFIVRTACARNSVSSAKPLPVPRPVIYGNINGIKAVAQGDMAVFFAEKEACRWMKTVMMT